MKGVLDFVSSPTNLIHGKEVAVLQGVFQGVREKDEKKVPVPFILTVEAFNMKMVGIMDDEKDKER